MASAVLLTYERKNSVGRNLGTRQAQSTSNGYLRDPDLSYQHESVAESDVKRPRFSADYARRLSDDMQSDTASGDSSSLKRKCMSLNEDAFNKSIIFYPRNLVKNLNKDGRQLLRKKLKMDLQHVRALSHKVQARELHVRERIQTTMNGRYSAGFDPRDSGQLMNLGKNSIPDGVITGHSSVVMYDEPSLETPGNGSINPRVGAPPKSRSVSDKKLSEILKHCGAILKKLMTHRFGWVFNEPVDAVKLNLHDYHTVIKKPMDLGSIKKKLSANAYLMPTQFAEDVRLTFANAMLYNPPGHDVHVMAMSLKSIFEEKWRTLEEKLINLECPHEKRSVDLYKEVTGHAHQVLASKRVPPSKLGATQKPKIPRKAKTSSKSKVMSLPLRKMTFAEKKTLSDNLGDLPSDKLELALQIMRRKSTNLRQTDDGIEVDIDLLDMATLWELHQLVLNSLQSHQSKEQVDRSHQAEKAAPSTSQLVGSSGLPKISQKVDGTDEEVDIGDEMPHPELPPVLIDKDRGGRKPSSGSSSSSRGSGSSSSDSDSGNSSESQSNAAAVHSAGLTSKLIQPEKEPKNIGDMPMQRGSDGVKRSLSGLDEEKMPAPGDVDSQDEASNERRHRAALLRTRFAETILEAHEKIFPLDKVSDPEKLKRAREEMERHKDEERARLQAEARAAEIAWNKAEVQAQAEAKRHRDAEREAARQALQNMEKTVVIDENSEILRDLEMLQTVPENIPSSADETSPVLSPDGMNSFAPQGGYPLLEQLGLFMKNDEEEGREASCKSDEDQGEIED